MLYYYYAHFYRWGNWGSEKLNYAQGQGKVEIPTQVCLLPTLQVTAWANSKIFNPRPEMKRESTTEVLSTRFLRPRRFLCTLIRVGAVICRCFHPGSVLQGSTLEHPNYDLRSLRSQVAHPWPSHIAESQHLLVVTIKKKKSPDAVKCPHGGKRCHLEHHGSSKRMKEQNVSLVRSGLKTVLYAYCKSTKYALG